MKTMDLVKILGQDERGRVVAGICLYQSPSFVLKYLSQYMTDKANTDSDWQELAAKLRAIAFEAEGKGM
jgi:hypothetical protein